MPKPELPQFNCYRKELDEMGALSMDLYLKHQRRRYQRGNRELKKRILDEFCETHGYHC